MANEEVARAAIISVSADGLGNRNPCKSLEELRIATGAAGSDETNRKSGRSLSLRVVLRPHPIYCRFPIALSDSDYTDIEEFQLRSEEHIDWTDAYVYKKQPQILLTDAFGLARRNVLQWGEKLLIRSARIVLEPQISEFEEPNSSNMRSYSDEALVKIDTGRETHFKLGWNESMLLPSVQARLLFQIANLATNNKEAKLFEKSKIINLLSLVDPRGQYIDPVDNPGLHREGGGQFGSVIPSSKSIFGLAVLLQKPNLSTPTHIQSEWSCTPTVIPSIQRGRSDPITVVITATKTGGSLDQVSVRRFTMAFEHVFAHVTILLHVRQFVEDWWAPLLSAINWEDKRQAAVNFIRAWQRHAVEIESKWALGAEDPNLNPEIVGKIAEAIDLHNMWLLEVRRVSDMLVLATQILDDGDMAIL